MWNETSVEQAIHEDAIRGTSIAFATRKSVDFESGVPWIVAEPDVNFVIPTSFPSGRKHDKNCERTFVSVRAAWNITQDEHRSDEP
jgi:hypothetical protein